jgi:lactoylglutathione lyase
VAEVHGEVGSGVNNSTGRYILSQTMLRIRDPKRSLPFYQDILGMTLLDRFDFPEMEFSLYFLAYLRSEDGPLPDNPVARAEFTFNQKAAIELTYNWGAPSPDFTGYHNGNTEPRGFGHIGITVPDVDAACARFDALGVEFVKRPNDGKMKGLAFIKDPDGYWIEILSAKRSAILVTGPY